MRKGSEWKCEACGKAVTAQAHGIIEVVDRRAQERARARADDAQGEDQDVADQEREDEEGEAAISEPSEGFRAADWDATVRHVRRPRVEFHVYHIDDCSPNDPNAYQILCSRAPDIDHWMSWMMHMAEKSWMLKDDLAGMMEFWYSGHGEKAPYELG